MGTETVLWQEKNDCVNFDVANVIIGVDMKFEKGLTEGVEIHFQHYLWHHHIIPLRINSILRIDK